MALAGCASSPPDTPVPHFSELRLGGGGSPSPSLPDAPARAEPPALRPRVSAPPEPTPVLPVTLDAAEARVAAYLSRAGFALEQRPDGPGQLVTATRMGPPGVLQGEAVCGLEAMRRPDVASTDVTVHLSPTAGGVLVQADARYVEIDTRLLSGLLARQTCRSRGVLETAVRRAALGG